MKFSIWPTSTLFPEIEAVAQHAAATGWDGVWVPDHFMNPERTGGTLEAFSVLAALASVVPRVHFGTLVAGNTYRHPAVTANIAASIDCISGGRFVLGLGAGWQVSEHEAYGIELGSIKSRLDRLEEACEIISSMFANERTTIHGAYYQLDDAPLYPRPIQQPLPLMVGGGGEKRTMLIAAKYADRWNYWGTPEIIRHKLTVLDEHCRAVGRDPKSIGRSTPVQLYMSDDRSYLDGERTRLENIRLGVGRRGIDSALVGTKEEVRDVVAEYQSLGVDELIIPDLTFGGLDGTKATMDIFREHVIDKLT